MLPGGIVTQSVSGHALVCGAWVPVSLITTSGFGTGLALSLLLRKRGERRGLWGLLHVLLPVPVALDTCLCLPPSTASFPDTGHRHRAKPCELFEMLPCTGLRTAPSRIAPSPPPRQWGRAGRMDFLLLSLLPHPSEAALRNNAAIYALKPR